MGNNHPPVWIITGMREGDNAQLRQLAGAIGQDFVEKKLNYNALYRLPNVIKGHGLWTVGRDARLQLKPPWPRVAIGVGRRSVPVARWLRHKSNGYTKLVHVGRPRFELDRFDLVVTTPQYRLPARPNVVQLPLPLSRLRGADLAAEAKTWSHLTDKLSAPFTSVLVGGDTDFYRLDADAATRLGTLLSSHAARHGGSLLITTSPRTSPQAEQALFDALDAPAYIYRWSDALGNSNPYLGLLALADDIVITSDSASLLSDALTAGRPISLFDTPLKQFRPVRRWLHGWFSRIEQLRRTGQPLPAGLRLLSRVADTGIVNAPRDMPHLFDALERENRLPRLGCGKTDWSGPEALNAASEKVLARIVERISGYIESQP
jgi:mitochondrial fission protein ELM1